MVDALRNFPGQGVEGQSHGRRIRIGTEKFCRELAVVAAPAMAPVPGQTPVYLAGERGWLAVFLLEDALRPEAPGLVASLRAAGLRLHLVSGDQPAAVASMAARLGIESALGGALPQDKFEYVAGLQRAGRVVAMIGDGLNDAAALAAADVGIAVSDDTACLVPACDAVIRGDRLTRLPAFLDYARRSRRVIVLCFSVSLIYNAVGLGLALAGRLTPLTTAILMPVSSLTIVALSAGLMRTRIARVLA